MLAVIELTNGGRPTSLSKKVPLHHAARENIEIRRLGARGPDLAGTEIANIHSHDDEEVEFLEATCPDMHDTALSSIPAFHLDTHVLVMLACRMNTEQVEVGLPLGSLIRGDISSGEEPHREMFRTFVHDGKCQECPFVGLGLHCASLQFTNLVRSVIQMRMSRCTREMPLASARARAAS